eukprot:TRINITY_DN5414_c0_g1_i2.p2 TRINITY_DN5414_c0_g1~~TRINITY_DN5414_c0_g1_i2.p2  ORF type:complete len:338 (+),score=37.08 TRINITY_DN5414_c0_g1_i2:102-1115(+)
MDFSLLDNYESPYKRRKISEAASTATAQQPSIFDAAPSTSSAIPPTPLRRTHLEHDDSHFLDSAEPRDQNDDDDSVQYSSEKRSVKDRSDLYGLGDDDFELLSEGSEEGEYIIPSFRATAAVLEIFNQHFILEPLKEPGSLHRLDPALRLVLKTVPDTVPSPVEQASEDEESTQDQYQEPQKQAVVNPTTNYDVTTYDDEKPGRGFSEQDDSLIQKEVIPILSAGRTPKWDQIATKLKLGKSGSQIKHRYFQWLDPSVRKGPYTMEEDKLLKEALDSNTMPIPNAPPGKPRFTNISPKVIKGLCSLLQRNEHQIRFRLTILRRKAKEEAERNGDSYY